MESKFYSYNSLKKDLSLSSEHDMLPENENSNFTSGRSIAHMLPPIKPSLNEMNEEANEVTLPINCSVTDEAIGLRLTTSMIDDVHKSCDWISPPHHTPPPHRLASESHLPLQDDLVVDKSEFVKDHVAPWKGSTAKLENSVSSTSHEINLASCRDGKEPLSTEEERTRSGLDKFNGIRVDLHDFLTTYKELDTLSLAKKVKDVLVANNIGQRIFGQAVLGLTQGSVSDLLSHPKSWESLSLKGREPFIRMQMWLDDPKHVELIRHLKWNNDSASASTSNRMRCRRSTKKKKSRVVLSAEDKVILLKAHATEPYPNQNTVYELARKLNKQPSTIVNWFHNYRSRVKRGFFNSAQLKAIGADGGNRKGVAVYEKRSNRSVQNSSKTPVRRSRSDRQKTPSMMLTATLLIEPSTQPATPLWSLRVAKSDSLLTSCDSLKTLFFNVCSTTSSNGTSIICTDTPKGNSQSKE